MARFIVWGYPWLVRGLLLGAGASLGLSLPSLARALRGRVTRLGLALALAVVAGALALRLSAPPRHRVFFDEYEHLDAARHLRAQGAFGVALAEAPGLDALATPSWPGAAHQLYAWLGPRWNAWASALTALALWALGALLYGESAGLAAAVLWAGSPIAQGYAGTATLEATAALFAALGLALAPAGRPRAALLLMVCAAHARPECALLVPLAWALSEERPPLWTGAAALAALSPVLMIACVAGAQGRVGYGEGPLAALRHAAAHLPRDAAFLLSPAGLCWTIAWPALLSLWKRRREPAARRLALASAALLLAYACHSIGDFGMQGSERYALIALLPALPMAGAAFGAAPPALGLAGAALGCALVWPRPLPEPNPEFVAEQAALERARRTLPPDAVVVAFSPAAVAVETGRAAISPYLLLGGTPLPAGTPFLFEDYWSRRRPEIAAKVEARLEERYAAAPADENGLRRLTSRSPGP